MIREWKDSSEMDVTEVRWIDLSGDRDQCCGHANAVMTLQVAYKATNFVSR